MKATAQTIADPLRTRSLVTDNDGGDSNGGEDGSEGGQQKT